MFVLDKFIKSSEKTKKKIPKQNYTKNLIKEMKKESLITYDAKSPKVNYESAIQKGEVVTFHILNRQ